MAVTAACAMTSVQAEPGHAPIPAHTATYEALRHGKKIGEIRVLLEQLDNGVWHYRTDTEATALWARLLNLSAEEVAHFVWRDNRIMTLTYHQVRHAPGKARFLQHEADWQAGITRVNTPDGEQTIPLEDDFVDPLSLRLQMAVNLANSDTRLETHHFRLLDRDGVEDKHYVHDGQEPIEVPAGCFNTVRVRRIEDADSSRTNLSWHTAEFHWMPLRILQRKEGRDRLDVRLMETSLGLSPSGCD